MTTSNTADATHYVATTTTNTDYDSGTVTPGVPIQMGHFRLDAEPHVDLKINRILKYVVSVPWAMEHTRLLDVVDVLSHKALGRNLTQEEAREYCGLSEPRAAQRIESSRGGAVAVIPLTGIIAHKINMVDNISGPGGTSIEGFRKNFRAAMNAKEVGSVIIDVDSPGGSVEGVQELADEVRSFRGSKPIVAVANSMAASAAFWIASAADQVSVIPSGNVGSIGVFAAHEDISERLEAEGVKVTLIHAGRFKVEGNPFEPLSDEGRAFMQERVDTTFEKFVAAVAAGRDTKASTVKKDFGEGRLVDADQALAAGMVDRIETLEQAIDRMRATRPPGAARAQLGLRKYDLAFK